MTKKKEVKATYSGEMDKTEYERLQKIASSNKVKMDKVLEEYEGELKRLKEAGMTTNLERLAVNAVMNIYRRIKMKQNVPSRKKKEVVTVYGFIVGDMGIWDKAEQVRRQVKTFIDQNGIQAAIEAQMVDGENHILDQRQKIYGRNNPNYLKPLDPNLHVLDRTLFGFFRHNGEKVYKYGSIQTSDNRLARGWSKVRFYTPCQVTATIREETAESISLGSSSAEETLSVFKAVKEDIDIKKVIDDTLGEKEITKDGKKAKVKEKWTPIKDVEAQHEAFKDAWDRKIFVKGIVAWMNIDRPTSFGAIYMGLMNPDNEDELVRVLIPEQIPIDFGELSEVYVFGKTKRAKYKDQETEKWEEGDVVINAVGVFPVVPTPKESGSSEGGKDEKEIEGWLD